MKRYCIGIDVGGTNIKFGLVDHSGRVLSRTALTTRTFTRSQKHLTEAIVNGVKGILAQNRLPKKNVLGVGIGLPGLVNYARGVVNVLTNIPGWKNVPFQKIIQKKIGLPVFIDNDVNVMTLGEWRYGAGVGINNLICMTLGTGVGGGLILDNKLYRGEGWTAGELGHVPLNENGPACNCGGFGCFERAVGNKFLEARARKIFKRNVSLEEVTALADKGDRRAKEFWKETGEHVGNGLVGAVNLLNPRKIIIGGGVAGAQQHLFGTIDKVIKRRAMKLPAGMVKVVNAKLGNDAGIIGARVLVEDAIQTR